MLAVPFPQTPQVLGGKVRSRGNGGKQVDSGLSLRWSQQDLLMDGMGMGGCEIKREDSRMTPGCLA